MRLTAWQRIKILIGSGLGGICLRILGLTWRYQVFGWPYYQDLRESGCPVILSCWHSQLLAGTYFWRHRGIVALASGHRDGEFIARMLQQLGFNTSRGSSTRGGSRALKELKKRIEGGLDVAITPDGPQGPRHQVKAGPVWLSLRTGAPIVCFRVEPERCWQLGGWDRFLIPKPFSRVCVSIGSPLRVTPELELGEWLKRYQAEMELVGSPISSPSLEGSSGSDQ